MVSFMQGIWKRSTLLSELIEVSISSNKTMGFGEISLP